MNFVYAPPGLKASNGSVITDSVYAKKNEYLAQLEKEKTNSSNTAKSFDLFVQYTDSINSIMASDNTNHSLSIIITSSNNTTYSFPQFTFQNNNEDLRNDDSDSNNSYDKFDEIAAEQVFDICATCADPAERNDLSQINIGKHIEFSDLQNEAIDLKAKLNNMNNLYEINQFIEYFEAQKIYFAKLNKFSDDVSFIIESLCARKAAVEKELVRNYIPTIKKSRKI